MRTGTSEPARMLAASVAGRWSPADGRGCAGDQDGARPALIRLPARPYCTGVTGRDAVGTGQAVSVLAPAGGPPGRDGVCFPPPVMACVA
jgi:hypothetical protein